MAGNSNNRKWWIAIVIGIVVAIAMATNPDATNGGGGGSGSGGCETAYANRGPYAENDHDTYIRNCEQGVRDLQKAEEQGS